MDYPDFHSSVPAVALLPDEQAAENEVLFVAAVRHAVCVLRGISSSHRAFAVSFCFEVEACWPSVPLLPDSMHAAAASLTAQLISGGVWRCGSTVELVLPSHLARTAAPPGSADTRVVWTPSSAVRARHNPYAGALVEAMYRPQRRTAIRPMNRTPSQQWLMHCVNSEKRRTAVPRDLFEAFHADCAAYLRGTAQREALPEMAVSVLLSCVREAVMAAYPRAFARFVGPDTPDTPDAWLAYAQRGAGLHLVSLDVWSPHAGKRHGAPARCCLGPWPTRQREPNDVSRLFSGTPQMAAFIRDVMLSVLFPYVLRTCGPSGVAMNASALLAQATALAAAAVAHDGVETVAQNDRVLACVIQHYYTTPDVLLMHGNEMMACVVERAAGDQEPTAAHTCAHIIALASALTGIVVTGSPPPTALLASGALCTALCQEVAALLVCRHDVYRHVELHVLERQLRASIRAALIGEDKRCLERRFCSPWCTSFTRFALMHQQAHPGLASFMAMAAETD